MLSNIRSTAVHAAPIVRAATVVSSQRQYASKVSVANPIVEIKGDGVAAGLWDLVSKKLVDPHVDVKKRTFDLTLENRLRTKDQITKDAAAAIKEVGAAVKCATTTPDESGELRSANATIRGVIVVSLSANRFVLRTSIPPFPRGPTQSQSSGRRRATSLMLRTFSHPVPATSRSHSPPQTARRRALTCFSLRSLVLPLECTTRTRRLRHSRTRASMPPLSASSRCTSAARTQSLRSMTDASRTSSRQSTTRATRASLTR
eukprot:Opistho-2@21041